MDNDNVNPKTDLYIDKIGNNAMLTIIMQSDAFDRMKKAETKIALSKDEAIKLGKSLLQIADTLKKEETNA